MKKLKKFGLVMSAGIFAFCMGFGIIFQTGITRVSAQSVAMIDGPIITEAGPLFNLDGTFNKDLVTELINLAESAEYSAPNLHADHHGVSGITVSDASHIRTANDGTLPDIMLFEPHGTFSTSGMPASGFVNDQSRDNFTHSRWRLVYITHPDNGGDPVFTFRMVEAFRNNRIHVDSTNWSPNVRYENSDIRTNLTDEFDNVLKLFDSNQMRNHFVAPENLSGTWQNTQPNTGNPINQALEINARKDLLWIPSTYEVGAGGGHNFWNLTDAERIHNANGFSTSAWTRSGQAGAGDNPIRARRIMPNGDGDVNTVTIAHAIVPALHLSLSNLAFNIATQINPVGQDAGIISVTGGATIGIFDGQTRTLTATANTGWRFINWELEGATVTDDTIPTITIIINESITAVANFERTYTKGNNNDFPWLIVGIAASAVFLICVIAILLIIKRRKIS